jgi:hypothetical protein
VPVHVDDVLEPEGAGETVGSAERLCGEPGQAVNVRRHPLGEQGPQHGVGQSLGVKQLFQPVQSLVAACMLVE